MTFYSIGIDYSTAALDKRERAYKRKENIRSFCRRALADAAVLVTCNRIEIYGAVDDEDAAEYEMGLIKQEFPEVFGKARTHASGEDILRHALRLASGLESQIRGEKEILKQLVSWREKELAGSRLGHFWDKVIKEARKIRIGSGLVATAPNIAEVIVKEFGIKGRVVVIGTGKIASLFAEIKEQDVEMVFVANKNHKKAKQLAGRNGGSAVLIDRLTDVARGADFIISATSSPHYVLSLEQLFEIEKRRGSRELHIFDLAFPRDIEPGAGNMPGISVRDLEKLNSVFEKHNDRSNKDFSGSESLIGPGVEKIYKELKDDEVKSRNQAKPAGIKAG